VSTGSVQPIPSVGLIGSATDPAKSAPLNGRPLLSVCIPAYQAERTLAETLHCVLAEDFADMEVLVLNNASSDRTAEILASFSDPRLRLAINPEVLSLPDNWNNLVSLSRGTLVKVVCADDLIRPGALRSQVELLVDRPDLAVVASRRDLIDDTGGMIARARGLKGLVGSRTGRQVVREVVRSGSNPIGESAGVMFRRADFDAVGGFDGELLFPMDLDLWVKLLRHGDFYGQAESLAAFRVSRTSLSAEVSTRQYEEQLTLTRRIAADPYWSVPRHDRLISHLRAPLGRVRRHLLFALVRWTVRT
jgi:glycosyltransferase involved in cell wall biosynthesis